MKTKSLFNVTRITFLHILFLLFVLFVVPVEVRAADNFNYTFTATYGQTEARAMLDMINTFRTDGNAWTYDQNENVVNLGNVGSLTYSYTLEAIAMKRAAELAVLFDHCRPTGVYVGTEIMSTLPATTYWGENIANGQTSAEEVFTAWQETDLSYDWQGHRRNMLGVNDNCSSTGYTSIGIGHVIYNQHDYWVQVFGTVSDPGTYTAPNDSTCEMTVTIDKSLLSNYTLQSNRTSITADLNSVIIYPDVKNVIEFNSCNNISDINIDLSYNFEIGDSSFFERDDEDGWLHPKKVGSTTLTYSSPINGDTLVIPVTIQAKISSCNITLDNYFLTYTGKELKPTVTVTLQDGTLLAEGTDYSVSYSNNINVGYGSVTITGLGYYTGTFSETFTILKDNAPADSSDSSSDNSETYGSLQGYITINNITYYIYGSDSSYSAVLIKNNKKSISSCNIPNKISYNGRSIPVVKISSKAFYKNKKLTSLTIGKNVQTIGENAFDGCKKLKQITINGKKLAQIDSNAFKSINKKALITVPKSKLSKYKKLLKSSGISKKVNIKKK